jgi:hypothetical protein
MFAGGNGFVGLLGCDGRRGGFQTRPPRAVRGELGQGNALPVISKHR